MKIRIKMGEGPRGCNLATGCEEACEHWAECMFSGCEVGVMYGGEGDR